MRGGAVAFVTREAVAGVLRVALFHPAVAGFFGDNRSGGNGKTFRVAFDDRFIRPRAGAVT